MKITEMTDVPDIELAEVDLFDPEFFADGEPHPVWAALRTRAPLHRQELSDGRAFWSVTRYRDVCRVLGDHRAFTSTRGSLLHQLGKGDSAAGRMLVATDPPHHTRLRRPLHVALSPSGVDSYVDDVHRAVAQVLRPARLPGTWDVAEQAALLPMAVIGALLGLPRPDWSQLARWTAMAAAPHDETLRVRSTATTLAIAHHGIFDYFTRRIASGDPVGLVADVELTEEEIVYNCYSLLLGATATIPHAVTGTVLALVQDPEQIADAAQDVPRLVEEGLRWASPANSFLRHAVTDAELAGGQVRAGDAIAVWIGSANRDDSVFADPYRFVATRQNNRHIAFGFGPHYCVGAALARVILRVFFTELLATVSSIELAGPVRHLSSLFVAGTTHLPVHTLPRAIRRQNSR
jgi:cytochrome P450